MLDRADEDEEGTIRSFRTMEMNNSNMEALKKTVAWEVEEEDAD
ncbi:hypothetical protein FACS189472_08850 [Alphaproteobacteria bacterium]|nr:hypothetical protein FACS189472_08850 [Alphaproteobacteria bacterium]